MEVIVGSEDYDRIFWKAKADKDVEAVLRCFTYVVIPQADFGKAKEGFLGSRGVGVPQA